MIGKFSEVLNVNLNEGLKPIITTDQKLRFLEKLIIAEKNNEAV